jgi:hypothetical protein
LNVHAKYHWHNLHKNILKNYIQIRSSEELRPNVKAALSEF